MDLDMDSDMHSIIFARHACGPNAREVIYREWPPHSAGKSIIMLRKSQTAEHGSTRAKGVITWCHWYRVMKSYCCIRTAAVSWAWYSSTAPGTWYEYSSTAPMVSPAVQWYRVTLKTLLPLQQVLNQLGLKMSSKTWVQA